jgi:GAG-pre-integrase domain
MPPAKARSYQTSLQALMVQLDNASLDAWYMDYGASAHVTLDLNALVTYSPYNGSDQLCVGDGKGLSILHTGTAFLPTNTGSLILTNVLHVPSISKPLLSISQLTTDNVASVDFLADSCFIKDLSSNKVLLKGIKINGLYIVSSTSPQALQCTKEPISLWHQRLCHTSEASLQHLISAKTLSCIQTKLSSCNSCCLAKSHRLPFPTSDTIASVLLQLIHCDVWGPSSVVSNLGYRYYVMFTDHFSRFSWIYFCSHKSDVTSIFTQFKLLVENVLDSKIKTVQIDGGTEFHPMIRSHPTIQLYISCPYTPQQNGIAERKHRHVVELSLASMFQARIP